MAVTTQRPRRRAARLARAVNPAVLRIARFIPFYCVFEHRGRRTGDLHRIPLAVVRTGSGFLLPIAFGEGANWVRNLRAAGGATVEWRGHRYAVVAPEVISFEAGAAELNPVQRAAAPLFGARQFMRVTAEASSR